MSLSSKKFLFYKAVFAALLSFIPLPAHGMMGRLKTSFQKVQQATFAGTKAWTNLPQGRKAQITVAGGCATAAAGCFAACAIAREEAHARREEQGAQINIEVRQLTPTEWPIWKTIYLAAVEKYPTYLGYSYEEVARRLDYEWKQQCSGIKSLEYGRYGVVFCAFHEKKIIGCIAFQIFKRRCFATVDALYVIPEYQGCGVAKKLVDALIAQAKEWKLHYLLCGVYHTNQRALHLWDSYGFANVGPADRKYLIKKLFLS
jgi:ribosomal protein S18 acetylase RimI-like enzyme